MPSSGQKIIKNIENSVYMSPVSSVVDWNCFAYLTLDLTFHFVVNPDLDPDWHQNNADPPAYPKFYTCWKICNIFYFFITGMPVYKVFLYSLVATVSWIFLDSILKYSWKEWKIHLLGIDINPDPAKWCWSNPIQIQIHNTACETIL